MSEYSDAGAVNQGAAQAGAAYLPYLKDSSGKIKPTVPPKAKECGAKQELPSSWLVSPIKDFRVFNGIPRGLKRDREQVLNDEAIEGLKDPSWNIMTNGAFTNYGPPISTLVQSGNLTNISLPELFNSGGIAKLNDGTIVICFVHSPQAPISEKYSAQERKRRRRDADLGTINHDCTNGHPGTRVVEYMGGGIQFLRDGHKLSAREIYNNQHLELGGSQLANYSRDLVERPGYAERMIFYGTRKGKLYLINIKTRYESPQSLAEVFCDAGFDAVVRYDAGSGYYQANKKGGSLDNITGSWSSSAIGLKLLADSP